jgi:hypothetical protein
MADTELLARIAALEGQNGELRKLVEDLKKELDATEKRLDQIEASQGAGGDKPAGLSKKQKKAAAKAAAKEKGDKKGGDKKGGGDKAAEARTKEIKASTKEGGKKGQDLIGMCDIGGMKYFTVAMETCKGDWELLEAAMAGANKPVDPDGDDRKGGAGELGKCFLSCDEKNYCAMLMHMPKDKQGDLSLKEWAETMISSPDVRGEIIFESEDGSTIKAVAKQNSEHELFPLKQRDAAINASFRMLKEKKLVADDDSESDDMGAMYEDNGVEW